MTAYRRSLTRVAAIATLAIGATPPTRPVPPADAAAIKALIHRIYGIYHHNREDKLAETAIFAPTTLAISAENTRLNEGEMGDIGADVFLDAQDHGEVTVDAIRLTGRADGRVDASVTFSDPELRVRAHRKAMILERESQGWRVWDLTLPGQGGYRAVMLAENKRLRAEKAGGRGALNDGDARDRRA